MNGELSEDGADGVHVEDVRQGPLLRQYFQRLKKMVTHHLSINISEWSGVEWSGVEWSGVEWSGKCFNIFHAISHFKFNYLLKFYEGRKCVKT